MEKWKKNHPCEQFLNQLDSQRRKNQFFHFVLIISVRNIRDSGEHVHNQS